MLPDELIEEVQRYTKGKTITESLLLALKEWSALQKIKELNLNVRKKPLKFSKGFSAKKARTINREL